MNRPYPQVGIAVDVKYFENNPFHVVGEKYINAVAHGCRSYPVLLPAMGQGTQLKDMTSVFDIHRIVADLDGLLLPGSVSNVNPALYGKLQETPDLPVDHQRDTTTLTMIQAAVEQGVPVLAVCRGFQELNVAFGGSIHQKVQETQGYMDHREDLSLPKTQQYEHSHTISITENGILHRLWGSLTANVNSLHGQGIDRLGDGLIIEARSPDLLIEAVSVVTAKTFALGVQWHPEWEFWDDELSKTLFNAFAKAVHERYRDYRGWPGEGIRPAGQSKPE